MTHVLVVNKNGDIEEHTVELDKLYTLCDYKTNKDFELMHSYDLYEIYGKLKGKSDNENKYVFPNLNITAYGKVCVVKKDDDITIDEWNVFADKPLANDNELTYEAYESE